MKYVNNNELRAWTPEQLNAKLDELRRDLLELRLKVATAHVKSYPSDRRNLKQAIAQILTHVRQKQLAAIV
jgi:large subunit ribosomal protein L29